jgi:hypothetical protein
VGVFALVLVLYGVLLPIGLSQWDPGEMQTVPFILGIPHAPGFPLYVLAGWLWSHAIPLGDVATRMTVLSAVCGAAAAYLAYRAAFELSGSLAAAILAAALFALAPIVVVHVTRAGVEPMMTLLIALAVFSALRFSRTGSPRALIVASGACGLALAVHTLAIWFLPGITLLLAQRLAPVPRRAIVTAAAAFLVGPLTYLYLPVRSAIIARGGLDPTVGLGMIPGVQGLIDNDHPAAWDGFVRHVTGAQYGAGNALVAPLLLGAYPSYLDRWWEILCAPAGIVSGALAVAGLAALIARRPQTGIALALVGFLAIPFSLRYGVLQDAAKYYVVAVWIAAVLAALGARALVEIGRSAVQRRTVALALAAAATFGVAHVIAADPGTYGGRHRVDGRNVVSGVIAATPPDAIVVAAWTYATPLAYAQYVEGSFGNRQVITDDAPRELVGRWVRERPVYVIPFDEGSKPASLELAEVPGSWPRIYRVLPPSP